MLRNKTVAVVVPAYNEEKQIKRVIEKMPSFVDRMVVVNDYSTDKTLSVLKTYLQRNNRSKTIKGKSIRIIPTTYNKAEIVLKKIEKEESQRFTPSNIINKNPDKERVIVINHLRNAGVGASIATGYRWCRDHNIDCTAVMAGDAQMDPTELKSICLPVIKEEVDYVKGNRLSHRSALFVVPKIRYFGNSVLSLLTKIASGYWHISDTQSGFTSISLNALNAIRLHKIYKKYGCPNDILVKLNIAFCTIKEVPIKPIYFIGENSKMKINIVIPKIIALLIKSFFGRLYIKYFFRDFHPLFLLYHLSFMIFLFNVPLTFKVIRSFYPDNPLSTQSFIAFVFLSISGFQSLFFAMWMDMMDNERLQK